MIRRATTGLVAAAMLAGCKGTPAPAPDPTPPATATARASAVVTAAVPVEPSAAATSSAAPSASAAPEAPPTRFSLAVDVAGEAQILAGKGGALLIANESDVLEIRGDVPRRMPDFLAGLAKYRTESVGKAGNLQGFGGRYPDGLYATIDVFAPRGTSDHEVHRWRGGQWSSFASAAGVHLDSLTAVTPYETGFAVAIAQMDGQVTLESTVSPGSFTLAASKDPKCKTRLFQVHDLVAPVTGGLVAVGVQCDGDHDAIEVFEGGKSTGVYALPDLEETRLAAVSPGEIYLAGVTARPHPAKPAASAGASAAPPADPAPAAGGKPYFAVLSRGAFSPRPLPGAEPITALDAASDGSLFVVSGGAVWRLPKGGAWTKIPLPEGATAKGVTVGSPSDVWAFGSEGKHTRIYRTLPLKYAVVMGWEERPPAKLLPVTDGCDSLLVVIAAMTDQVASDYTFPLARDAMKGHPELDAATLVVTEERQLGAFVPSREVGEKVVALMKEKLKGQKPQLVCAKPRIRAEIVFDRATGALVH